MKTRLIGAISGGILFAMTAMAAMPARADKYVYYPAQQVYYSPVHSSYYYMDNGVWVTKRHGPKARLGKSVAIDLNGPVPYTYHPTVIQQYPVPPIQVNIGH